jgi:hypothetical protein
VNAHVNNDVYVEFSNRLNGFGSEVRRESDDTFRIMRWGDVELEPNVRLHISAAALIRRLHDLRDDGSAVFPDADEMTAALQLFLVHVDETVRTLRQGQTDIVLEEGGALLASPDGP